jgi:hypothetical protein
MTTDKLSAAHEAQILRLIADAARGFPYDRFSAALTYEAARREGVENAPKCPQCSAAGYCTGKCNIIPAPPADERAQLERERDAARSRADRRFEEYVKQGEELRAANARAAAAEAREKSERDRRHQTVTDIWRLVDPDSPPMSSDEREAIAALSGQIAARDQALKQAEARERGLREAAKAYRQSEQDYVFMAERPDEEYVPADVRLARMHMHRAAGALDAALAQKEPSNG